MEVIPSTNNKGDKATMVDIMSNHLVMDDLLTYLDHFSIKILASVCWEFRRLIWKNRSFLNRTRINLNNDKVTVSRLTGYELERRALDMTFLAGADFPWTTLKLQVVGWTRAEYQALIETLSTSNVQKLELCNSQFETSFLGDHGMDLIGFLAAAKKLKEISIEAMLLRLTPDDSNLLATNLEIQESLKKVESLIVTFDAAVGIRHPILEFQVDFGKGFTALAAFPQALNSFGFDGFHVTDPAVVKTLLSLIEKHKSTLTSLELREWAWDSDAILDIILPRLRHLLVEAAGQQLSRVASFITKQSPLLTLSVELYGSTVSPQPLVNALLTFGSQLTKLSLSWKLDPQNPAPENDEEGEEDEDEEEVQVPPLDFNFLQKIENLREIRILQFARPTHLSNDLGARAPAGLIFSSLPDGILQIDLAGCELGGMDNDLPEVKMESLARFRNLTVLNLVRCQNALDDKILLYISSNFPQLRELGFSHCDRVTDMGLTGVRNGQSFGSGISALTGLKKLRILFCEWITVRGLLDSISFRELKELDLGIALHKRFEMTVDFYERIHSQNPMLEIFRGADNATYWNMKPCCLTFQPKSMERSTPRFNSVTKIDCWRPILIAAEDEVGWHLQEGEMEDVEDQDEDEDVGDEDD